MKWERKTSKIDVQRLDGKPLSWYKFRSFCCPIRSIWFGVYIYFYVNTLRLILVDKSAINTINKQINALKNKICLFFYSVYSLFICYCLFWLRMNDWNVTAKKRNRRISWKMTELCLRSSPCWFIIDIDVNDFCRSCLF